MSCSSPGATHHLGCACHESAWAEKLAAAEERARRLEEALREVAAGEHGEYCGFRNAMLVQGGKSKCYADCPVNIASVAIATPHGGGE